MLTVHVKELVGANIHVADCNVSHCAYGHIGAFVERVKLFPRGNLYCVLHTTRTSFYKYVLVALRSVGSHLEKDGMAAAVKLAVAHNDIATVESIAAKGHAGVGVAPETALFHYDTVDRAGRRVTVNPSATPAFQANTIVAHVDIAASDEHVVAVVKVYAVAARGTGAALRGRFDVAVKITHTVAAVKVVCPEGAVDGFHILNRHIVGIGDIHKLRTQGFEVGTLPVPLPANPEFLPKTAGIAVNRTVPGNGETVVVVGIYECGKILHRKTFHVHVYERIVLDGIYAFQFAAVKEVQMCAGLEEKGTGEERTARDDHHTATLAGTAVNHFLKLFRLQSRGIVPYSVVGHYILAA